MRKVLKKLYKKIALIRGDATDPLAERASLKARLSKFQQGGRVLLIEKGRDCDGVQYDGHTSIIPATVTHYEAELRDREASADGPFWLRLDYPSKRHAYKYTSRDLALEAYENGHAHVLRP